MSEKWDVTTVRTKKCQKVKCDEINEIDDLQSQFFVLLMEGIREHDML